MVQISNVVSVERERRFCKQKKKSWKGQKTEKTERALGPLVFASRTLSTSPRPDRLVDSAPLAVLQESRFRRHAASCRPILEPYDRAFRG
jgi:hypothetical protein